jgi:CheY-like chemotaxis protein
MTMARILVVDDKAENRDLLSYLFGYFHHEVVTASDGADAVRAALAEAPDLIVMDIAMPGMDGYTAARFIRSEQALSRVPLVAVSAIDEVTPEAAQASGFDAFYPIPIEPQVFITRMESILRRKSPASEVSPGES